MAMAIPIGELVLSGIEGGEVGNIVAGAETMASQFKNEIIKGSIFGTAEGALFGAGQKLYNEIKDDLGFKSSNAGSAKRKRGGRRNHR
tara:strand:- start:766 stop:1029 length:264 start_codon:yes stop_codon:yes gene_type:complete